MVDELDAWGKLSDDEEEITETYEEDEEEDFSEGPIGVEERDSSVVSILPPPDSYLKVDSPSSSRFERTPRSSRETTKIFQEKIILPLAKVS